MALLVALLYGWVAGLVAQYPQAQIRSGSMVAQFYLPDPARGFYRGTRFDWGGVLFDLQVGGHTLYRPWFSRTDPAIADFLFQGDSIAAGPNSAMTGPADEFRQPLGYDSAQPGETFLKLGVGLLRRINNEPYTFRTRFELVDGGHWKVTQQPGSITFQQTLGTPTSNYAYLYTKTIRLEGRNHRLKIEHELRNLGRLPIQTTVYNHNFLTVDQGPVDAGYTVMVPFDLTTSRPPDSNLVRIAGHSVSYLKDLTGEEVVSFPMQGFSASAQDYDLRLLDREAGLQVHLIGDRPLANLLLWSIRTVLAVEPFIAVDTAPGERFTWSATYTYTNIPKTGVEQSRPDLPASN